MTPYVLHTLNRQPKVCRASGLKTVLLKSPHTPDISQRLIHIVLVAVLYTADLRAPKLDGPAVRMLSWNVASLRSSLKKVQVSENPHKLISDGVP